MPRGTSKTPLIQITIDNCLEFLYKSAYMVNCSWVCDAVLSIRNSAICRGSKGQIWSEVTLGQCAVNYSAFSIHVHWLMVIRLITCEDIKQGIYMTPGRIIRVSNDPSILIWGWHQFKRVLKFLNESPMTSAQSFSESSPLIFQLKKFRLHMTYALIEDWNIFAKRDIISSFF